ncbi:MAG: MBOAT family protein [Deltaproteobacteria bacterium]|nr:MBOAT family protein [Deltaproteobacteria bacterium]
MLFNSGEFLFFFIFVYGLYLLSSHRWQNYLLLAASYLFYGSWDWRFLILILFSTVVDYTAAIYIDRAREKGIEKRAKAWLLLSVSTNLGLLGFFKYYNFFAGSLMDLAGRFGVSLSPFTLNIILPAGISFYTFQAMSYTIDVYRGRQTPCKSLPDFTLFVAFFPQLMAGPIERAKELLPQIENPRRVTQEDLIDGGWLILWGLFKKVFIADNLAPYTYWAFTMNRAQTSSDLYIASIAFVIRFYCDFSGYSDMALGLGRFFGVRLHRNFYLPYFSSNPTEFWNRWHITLSRWFRDYVYGPIRKEFSAYGAKTWAVLPTMFLVGLWHGANWTFVVWGTLWGAALLVHRLIQPRLASFEERNPGTGRFMKWGGTILTFHMWIVIGLFFVNTNVHESFSDVCLLFSGFSASRYSKKDLYTVLYYSWPLVLMQFAQNRYGDLDVLKRLSLPLRVVIYCALLVLLMVNGAEHEQEFIYFQF